jgi:hypothetical protein
MGRRAMRSRYGLPCPFYPRHSSHRDRSVSRGRRGEVGRRHRRDGRRRDRRHSRRVADAAGIVDRAVQSARIRRPRRNAADAGILGRRCRGSGQNTQHRNARECSAGDPSARENRNWLRAPHQSVIHCRLVRFMAGGKTSMQAPNSSGFGFPKAGATTGPRLSIVPPWFGQTGVKCGARRRRRKRKSARRPDAADIVSTERR